MNDTEYHARKKKLFPDGVFEQGLYEGLDQFIGRLRELEDGKDPFKGKRRTLGEETVMAMSTVPGWASFRDERDRELWSQRDLLWLMPSKRKFLRDPILPDFATEKNQA
tara:strand:- start:198 stop:524 length:327 start_codon:yes stop_codon:yes gene_type:complete